MNYHNIDKSAFHPGEYVGHATGAWRIRRNGRKGWRASAGTHVLFGDTLREISKQLEELNRRYSEATLNG